MITKEEAMIADMFHFGTCKKIVGPKGGIKLHIEHWRRNGQTKTWKTRPDMFVVPVKYGLKAHTYISNFNAKGWHTAENCPLNKESENVKAE